MAGSHRVGLGEVSAIAFTATPAEVTAITELIARLRDEAGYTILVIEHDMHVVEGISDRVVALDHGVKIAEGSFEAVATNEKVVEAYLGLGATDRK